MEVGLAHPYNLFAYTSRTHINLDISSGNIDIHDEWFKQTKILFKITHEYFYSNKFTKPLILYIYKYDNNLFTQQKTINLSVIMD